LLTFIRFCLPFLPSLLPMVSWFRPSAGSATSAALACPTSGLPPYQQDHALAVFEQGVWLAELELLQLANALQRSAISRGGYDGRSFDLMFAIADVLESDHGWSFEQSDAWLERMGLWEEEF
jgi:hypothetical protein